MQGIAFTIGDWSISYAQAVFGLGALVILLLVAMMLSLRRAHLERSLEAAAQIERAREMDDKVAELNRLQAEVTVRMQTMAEIFGSRQADMVRLMAERLDGLQARMGQGLEASGKSTAESLQKLHERLAVIDSAQKNLTDLAGEVMTLRDVLANKQARGAYGQGRMEAIIRDGLPPSAYAFQVTLSNRTRPDCVVALPGDPRGLVIDAKFPLEGFQALKEAAGDEARKVAMQRVRADLAAHVKDIAEKYVAADETQDIALMFVPSEAVYADLLEHFEDIVQRAHRARVVIVSPSLLAMAIQVLQALVRDARMRDEARVIQSEVGKLLDDVRRLGERVTKLDQHFRQASEDVAQIKSSSEKITKRGERIETLDFEGEAPPAPRLAAARAAE